MPSSLLAPKKSITLLDYTLRGAITKASDEVAVPKGTFALTVQTKFVYGSGGTAVKCYLQTSFDGGVTWVDIACHAYVGTTATKISSVRVSVAVGTVYTPTNGTLTDDTIKDGLIGDRVRLLTVVTGTYATTSSIIGSLTFND